jgi:ABC-type Na+ transport system ATPase subunit NatA
MITIDNLNLKKKIPEISQLNLQIDEGESYVLLSSGESIFDHLLNIFSGVERDFSGEIRVDAADIRADWDRCRKNIAILSAGRQWPPDMKIGAVVSFFKNKLAISEDEFEALYMELNIESIYQKKISELEEVEWRNILFALAQLKKSKNYILRDFAGGMPLDFNLEFKKTLSRMKIENCSILYLSGDVFFAPEIGDRIGFMKKGKLLLELKAPKMKKMDLKELYFEFLAER